ncbi:MAG: helix-turn-helix domain-containing protein, partial [Asticcacaulis sp.]|nr:helix-turn-helix domain-containing protein [Asticcacaulis sp.]
MSRAQRLLDLLDLLRRHRFPVAGASLARELDVSLRTLYRDIATLQGPQAATDHATYRVWQKPDTQGGPAGKYLV